MRESCKSGSVGEEAGDRRLYPTRAGLRRLLDGVDEGDLRMVTRLDRLARSTRDLLNTLAFIADQKDGFRSLGDTWADTRRPRTGD